MIKLASLLSIAAALVAYGLSTYGFAGGGHHPGRGFGGRTEFFYHT